MKTPTLTRLGCFIQPLHRFHTPSAKQDRRAQLGGRHQRLQHVPHLVGSHFSHDGSFRSCGSKLARKASHLRVHCALASHLDVQIFKEIQRSTRHRSCTHQSFLSAPKQAPLGPIGIRLGSILQTSKEL